MEKLVVIGGTAAGMSAAAQARRGDPGLSITVFEKTSFVTYGSCGLPYFITDEIKGTDNMIVFTPEQLKKDRNIKVKIHHEVLDIDPKAKALRVKDLKTGKEFNEDYSQLVMATGASPVVPPIPGNTYENIVTLRNLDDGVKIKQLVQSGEIEKVAILGAGFIGLEMAEAFRKLGLETSVFEMLPEILPQIDRDLISPVEKELKSNGVNLYKDTKVVGFEAGPDGKVQSLITEGGESFDVDLVLLAVGARPNSQLAAKAGIKLGKNGAIVVDKYMGTSLQDIWACGDCALSFHRLTQEPVYVPLGTTANKQGKIAGRNITGDRAPFPGILGTQVTKIFNAYVASTGLTSDQAKASGFNPLKALITHTDKAGNYPGNQPLQICLIFDQGKGKILGAQLVGSEGVAKRVDVFATAITAGMNVYELSELDLAYAPPVAPVYDPILIAGSVAIRVLERSRA